MRNIRLTVAYDGRNYSGWQTQPNVPTIQETIETHLAQMTQQRCRLRGAGRTDAGVHALGQVANFYTDSSLSLLRLHRGLCSLLPPDISVLKTEEVSVDVDTRRDNRGKHYRYAIFNRRERDLRKVPFAWHTYGRLDLSQMAVAAAKLVGLHDFAAFRASDCDRHTTKRLIYRCTIDANEPMVFIDVEGTGFLKNMVRIIAGTLVAVGLGRRDPAVIDKMLTTGVRDLGGPTAPAQGLTMMKVFL